MPKKVHVELSDDVYNVLREAYSLMELELLLRAMLHPHLKEHVHKLKGHETSDTSEDPKSHDPHDHSPHEWTH